MPSKMAVAGIEKARLLEDCGPKTRQQGLAESVWAGSGAKAPHARRIAARVGQGLHRCYWQVVP
jgi:hypothetical protein